MHRIVYMGSPEFAVPTLRALHTRYSIMGVVTQPDRPAGRGRQLTPPPVKTTALELGLPVLQPERLRQEALEQIRLWAPDVIVVAAFGQILRPAVLELPPHGCINVHASLLPRWRGAAPIHAAILNGDQETGISIMQMDMGIDTGPVLSQEALTIEPGETAERLGQRLADLGAQLLLDTLPRYLAGELQPKPQAEDGASYAPMLSKQDGLLDINQAAEHLNRQVRACIPWPGAYLELDEHPVRVFSAYVSNTNKPPGSRLQIDGLPAIATGEGALVLRELQPAGKRRMDGKTFLSGARDWLTQGRE